jgi:hypothetical protein
VRIESHAALLKQTLTVSVKADDQQAVGLLASARLSAGTGQGLVASRGRDQVT